jgi:hypothetical protein
MLKWCSAFATIPLVLLLALAPAQAQTSSPLASPAPAPGTEAAARELIETMKLADQFKLMMPMIFRQMKPVIVQNRPEVERDFDALVPKLLQRFNARSNELVDGVVLIYASNFTVAELHDITAFYKTPTGQKLLQRTPGITQQTMIAGQKFGQSAGAEAQKEMIDELRNRGHAL